MDILEHIYIENVLLDEIQSDRYEKTLKGVMDVLIFHMKKTPLFYEFFDEVYFGGSFFDGLKLASTSQEFDLNLVFKFKSDIKVKGLNTEYSKPNFAYLKLEDGYFLGPTKSERQLSVEWETKGIIFLSPSKLLKMVETAADESLARLNGKIPFNGKAYNVKKHSVGVPYTLAVDCKEDNFECTIDLVPAVSLQITKLEKEVQARVKTINKIFNSRVDKCMAIALKPVDKDRFEIDFHDIERDILRWRKIAKMVVMLMKHLRDIKGGPLDKFWSHLLKTVVMNKVIESESRSWWTNLYEQNCWDEGNVEKCLIDCMEAWINGIDNGINDAFFPDLDMMDRLSKFPQAVSNTRQFLRKLKEKISDSKGVFRGYYWKKV